MTSIEILSIIGALSWLPHLIKLIKEKFVKSHIRIIMPKFAEIGFTTYGHIFNTKIAFVTEHKDIVISGVYLSIRHDSGEEKNLFWQGVVQRFSELKNAPGNTMAWEKEQSVLAIKLTQKEIEERFIRFQEETYLLKKEDFENNIIKKAVNISKSRAISFADIKEMDEYQDIVRFINQSFNWKPGKYTIEFNIEASKNFVLTNNIYTFELSHLDVQAIEQNKDLIEKSYNDEYNYLIDSNYKSDRIFWNWRNPRIILNEFHKIDK